MIKPIEWTFAPEDGVATYFGFGGLLEVYQCSDLTWRVYFQMGYATSARDVKQRNIATRDEAMAVAQQWWEEWLELFVIDDTRREP